MNRISLHRDNLSIKDCYVYTYIEYNAGNKCRRAIIPYDKMTRRLDLTGEQIQESLDNLMTYRYILSIDYDSNPHGITIQLNKDKYLMSGSYDSFRLKVDPELRAFYCAFTARARAARDNYHFVNDGEIAAELGISTQVYRKYVKELKEQVNIDIDLYSFNPFIPVKDIEQLILDIDDTRDLESLYHEMEWIKEYVEVITGKIAFLKAKEKIDLGVEY